MQTATTFMKTSNQKEITFSVELEKLLIGIGAGVAVVLAMIAWAILPGQTISGTHTDIVGRNVIPYVYTQGKGNYETCYQEETRYGRILTAETICK